MQANRLVMAVILAAGAAGAREGLKPRLDLRDYPASMTQGGVGIGAAPLAPEQVRKTFATDLNHGYVVVEVMVKPGPDHKVDVETGDFILRIAGTKVAARPAGPQAIAAILQKTASSPHDVAVYPQVGIGYESGPRGYDPMTGTVRGGGVYTSAGVGVGVGGGPAPASTDRDRRTMEQELSDKALPEGATYQPVAGYLYFPLRSKKKHAAYELEYNGAGTKMTIRLPSPTQ